MNSPPQQQQPPSNAAPHPQPSPTNTPSSTRKWNSTTATATPGPMAWTQKSPWLSLNSISSSPKQSNTVNSYVSIIPLTITAATRNYLMISFPWLHTLTPSAPFMAITSILPDGLL